MKCPNCTLTSLLITERNGIEIDYCPDCRGVWLDRGELDKLIERSSPPPMRLPDHDPRQHSDREHRHREHYDKPKYKKKESFLSELFDF